MSRGTAPSWGWKSYSVRCLGSAKQSRPPLPLCGTSSRRLASLPLSLNPAPPLPLAPLILVFCLIQASLASSVFSVPPAGTWGPGTTRIPWTPGITAPTLLSKGSQMLPTFRKCLPHVPPREGVAKLGGDAQRHTHAGYYAKWGLHRAAPVFQVIRRLSDRCLSCPRSVLVHISCP